MVYMIIFIYYIIGLVYPVVYIGYITYNNNNTHQLVYHMYNWYLLFFVITCFNGMDALRLFNTFYLLYYLVEHIYVPVYNIYYGSIPYYMHITSSTNSYLTRSFFGWYYNYIYCGTMVYIVVVWLFNRQSIQHNTLEIHTLH